MLDCGTAWCERGHWVYWLGKQDTGGRQLNGKAGVKRAGRKVAATNWKSGPRSILRELKRKTKIVVARVDGKIRLRYPDAVRITERRPDAEASLWRLMCS
jgi:hypothetical protein